MTDSRRAGAYGLALDIGTTDIKGSLVDMTAKKECAYARVPNQQKKMGQDVVTRLGAALSSSGRERLHREVIKSVNSLIAALGKERPLRQEQIVRVVCVGNTAMFHLMLKLPVESLARAPFAPAKTTVVKKQGRDTGFNVDSAAECVFLPPIAGFVGSDLLAALLSSGMYRSDRYVYIMDLGTNGEMALGKKGKIVVASCASGPALEGRHISCGKPAGEGAIVRVQEKNNTLEWVTADGSAPAGISGSGLIDLIGLLRERGIIECNGRLKGGSYTFYRKGGTELSLTQEDIRQFQLAKAAFAAGTEIIIKEAGCYFKDIEAFFITGTFGHGIEKKNARKTGLIPKEMPLRRVKMLERGALAGARMVLLDAAMEETAVKVRRMCRHVALHAHRTFEEIYARSMAL